MTAESSDDRFIEALGLALLCRCDRCGLVLPLESIEWIMDQDPMRWAAVAAIAARDHGWECTLDSKLLCPACVSKTYGP